MKFDADQQRRIMGKFATGVTVASTCAEGQHWGMTANAVTSVSLDPPLVLLCVARGSQSHGIFEKAGCFALSILAVEQQEVSNRFAVSGPKDFSGLAFRTAVTGAPILEGALAWIDCRVVEQLPGGDHTVFIGEIQAGQAREGEPLLFFAGRYARLAPAGDAGRSDASA